MGTSIYPSFRRRPESSPSSHIDSTIDWPPALYVCFSDFLINSNCGLWSLWAKEGAVENGLIVFHGKPSGSP
jgi:hypothetical protein